MEQIKALGVSQAGLPFELDVSVTLVGVGQARWQRKQKGRVLLGFWSQLWRGAETPHTSPRATAPSSGVHRAPGGASREDELQQPAG